jgi:hypothetical protein
MLDNGNMLLVEAEAGRIVEVGPDGQTVWEWIPKLGNTTVPLVQDAARRDITRKEIASWPCSSVDSVSTSAQ